MACAVKRIQDSAYGTLENNQLYDENFPNYLCNLPTSVCEVQGDIDEKFWIY